jgi:hypothetical protein
MLKLSREGELVDLCPGESRLRFPATGQRLLLDRVRVLAVSKSCVGWMDGWMNQ